MSEPNRYIDSKFKESLERSIERTNKIRKEVNEGFEKAWRREVSEEVKNCPICGRIVSKYSSDPNHAASFILDSHDGPGTGRYYCMSCVSGLLALRDEVAELHLEYAALKKYDGEMQKNANEMITNAENEITKLKAENERLQHDRAGWAVRSLDQFNRIGKALNPIRKKRSTGEPARDDATEIEELVADIERKDKALKALVDASTDIAKGFLVKSGTTDRDSPVMEWSYTIGQQVIVDFNAAFKAAKEAMP